MSTPFTAGPFGPDAMFAGAAAGFYELLKAFGAHSGESPDLGSLGRALGGQFEQWLKVSQAPGLSAGAAFAGPEGRSVWDLLMQLTQLQAELGAHWSAIAGGCAQRFIERARTAGVGALTPEGALKLYELWVDCAEEAYAARVRTEEFASLQARLANTAAELLLAQRRQAEPVARASGQSAREEIEALERRLRELRRKQRPPARPRSPAARPRAAGPARARRRRGGRPRA